MLLTTVRHGYAADSHERATDRIGTRDRLERWRRDLSPRGEAAPGLSVRRLWRRAGRAREHRASGRDLHTPELRPEWMADRRRVCAPAELGRWTWHRAVHFPVSASA